MLKSVYLSLRKVKVQKVTVVEFGMYNIAVAMVLAVLKSRYGRMQLMNVIVAGPSE